MTGRHRYAELHAHSAYSFLDGANEPDDLASAAVDLWGPRGGLNLLSMLALYALRFESRYHKKAVTPHA